MYIHRIILRDVHNFDDLDITFYDDVWQKPLNSVLITGLNGSGKTTLLRIMATLWYNFQWWLKLEKDGGVAYVSSRYKLHEIDVKNGLMAIELREFGDDQNDYHIPSSLWLFVASDDENMSQLPIYDNPEVGYIGLKGRDNDFKIETSLDKYLIENLITQLEALQVGVTGVFYLPNMMFFDTVDRTILEPPDQTQFERQPESLYRWFVSYSNRDRMSTHLETMLKNIKLRNPSNFEDMIKNINQFFQGQKQITDFDAQSRLLVRVNKTHPTYHYIEALSSGEQQCLIMMVMVSRWLMPGGVVLIDEPDLHLHVSLQRHFIHELEKIVHSRNGQLIVTSHSPEIWDEFSETQRRRLGVKDVING